MIRSKRINAKASFPALGGKEWEGFTINQKYHTLHIPGFSENKAGFTSSQLKTLFFKISYLPRLERELYHSKEEISGLQNALTAERKKNDYYRQQIKEADKEFIYSNTN